MSAPVAEGGHDDDDILGFPGDGFEDKTDTNPGVFGEQDEEGDETQMDVTTGGSVQGSAFHNQRFFHWSHHTWRSVNSLSSRNSSHVFGNPS